MRAELNISCRRAGIDRALRELYKAHDPSALSASSLAKKAPNTAKSVTYAAYTRGLIVMAELVGDRKLVLYVESTGGLLRAGAEDVWEELAGQAKALKPKLTRLVLFDEDANDVIAKAAGGVLGRIRREDMIGPLATAAISALVLIAAIAFGSPSADFFYGSATALGVGLVYVIWIVWSLRSKKLLWR